jgi:hypothetical protein
MSIPFSKKIQKNFQTLEPLKNKGLQHKTSASAPPIKKKYLFLVCLLTTLDNIIRYNKIYM